MFLIKKKREKKDSEINKVLSGVAKMKRKTGEYLGRKQIKMFSVNENTNL